jgi:hypothetical protein
MVFNFQPVLPFALIAFMYVQFRSVPIPWGSQIKLLFTPANKDIFETIDNIQRTVTDAL